MHGEHESSEALIVALADFIPPLALSMLRTPAPGSSLTWMLELLTDTLTGFGVMLEQSPRSFSSQGDGVFARTAYSHLFAS